MKGVRGLWFIGILLLVTGPLPAQEDQANGVVVQLEIDRFAGEGESSENGEGLEVFTDRPFLLGGLSFVLIAPEHPLRKSLTVPALQEQVEEYAEAAAEKSLLERTAPSKKLTGSFLGSYVVHPLSGWRIPIWVSEYVAADYPRAAWVGIPAHDPWQFRFARAHGIDVVPVVRLEDRIAAPEGDELNRSYNGKGVVVDSGGLSGLEVTAARGPRNPAFEKAVSVLVEQDVGTKAQGQSYRSWLQAERKKAQAEMEKLAQTKPEPDDEAAEPSGEMKSKPSQETETPGEAMAETKAAEPKKAPETSQAPEEKAPRRKRSGKAKEKKPAASEAEPGLYDVVEDDGMGIETKPAAGETQRGERVRRLLEKVRSDEAAELNMMVDRLWLFSQPRMGERERGAERERRFLGRFRD